MGKTKDSTGNDGSAPALEPRSGDEPRTETAAAVVIGCGLTGLAVASELSRHGIDPIVLNGLRKDTGPTHIQVPDALSLPERAELLRLLHGYAAGHSLDIRRATPAEDLGLLRGSGGLNVSTTLEPGTLKWVVRTRHGVLLADSVVLAGCGQPALVKLIRTLGFAAGAELRNALRSAGLYVVGAGEALTAPTRELVRQAKRASQEIAARNATLHGASILRYGTG